MYGDALPEIGPFFWWHWYFYFLVALIPFDPLHGCTRARAEGFPRFTCMYEILPVFSHALLRSVSKRIYEVFLHFSRRSTAYYVFYVRLTSPDPARPLAKFTNRKSHKITNHTITKYHTITTASSHHPSHPSHKISTTLTTLHKSSTNRQLSSSSPHRHLLLQKIKFWCKSELLYRFRCFFVHFGQYNVFS